MNSIFVRIVLYVLSPLLASLAALVPGWGVSFDGQVLSIELEALVVAVIGGLGLSGAIFARWGVR